MTIRLDRIALENAPRHPFCGCWTISFKGVGGKGVYGQLVATPNGLLLLHDMSDEQELIVPGLAIPAGADTHAVSRCIAQALLALGWGPEVDQGSNVVASDTYEWQAAWR
jgi:hypothetical protein